MSDLICRKTMMRCQTPGMCSPHGGCSTGVLRETDVRYTASSQAEPDKMTMIEAGKFIDYVWSLREERDTLAQRLQEAERLLAHANSFLPSTYAYALELSEQIDAFLAGKGDKP